MTVLVLAVDRPDPTTWVGPGLLGLAVILGLAVATVLLWRNMNKQLGKIHFDEGNGDSTGEGDSNGPGFPPAGSGNSPQPTA